MSDPGQETGEWTTTRVQSVREVRDAEIESKKFELHREREDIDASLTTKDVQLQKEVRGITEECGKLRLEVEWLERDLSEVQESARRKILELRTVLQAKKMQLDGVVRDNQKTIQMLKSRVGDQRDSLSHAIVVEKSKGSAAEDDVSAKVEALNVEINNMRSQMYKSDQRYEADTREAKQTSEMLRSEIRNVHNRERGLDTALEKQRLEMDRLQKKLGEAEEASTRLKSGVRKLTDQRRAMLKGTARCDEDEWLMRLRELMNDE